MPQVKVTQIGTGLGVVLPEEQIKRLDIKNGQMLRLSETPNGFELTAVDPEFERQMRAAAKIMDRYRDTLRRLAE